MGIKVEASGKFRRTSEKSVVFDVPVQALDALGLANVIADPGNGAAIPVTSSGHCDLNIVGSGHDRSLAAPTVEGQVIQLTHKAGANAGTVTVATGLDAAGNTVLNFEATTGQSIILAGTYIGSNLRWRILWQKEGVPVYVPAVTDPGNGGAIAVTMSGICDLNIAGAGHNRSLAAPSFEGQTLTLRHTAGANAGTVTVTNGFCEAGATVLNFVSTVGQSITLIGRMVQSGNLRWRVLEDTNKISVSRDVPVVANGAAVPVDRDNALVHINAAGAGENRTLADPGYNGQLLTLQHDAGANTNTVTGASDVTKTSGQNVVNFTAALYEIVVLQAVNSKWRIICNPDGLTID